MVYTSNSTGFSTGNMSFNSSSNASFESDTADFEAVVSILVPIIFGTIAFLGFFGNLLVIVVVICNHQMRSTTNILILNLGVADMFFIIICVPFTAVTYASSVWPFGTVWCKIYQYMINVTAYASVYTLVLMSLDRYLAVVHPISSMTIRTDKNAYRLILLSWAIICTCNIPILLQFTSIQYSYMGENRSACLSEWWMEDENHFHTRMYHGCLFAFGYVIPLTLVTLLYGAMIKRLLLAPRTSRSEESLRSKRRVTRMVVIVVVMFALCWLPIQIIFMIMYFGTYPDTKTFVGFKIASTCWAYMNSCINPFLYAFLSENFRKSFIKLLTAGRLRLSRYEMERRSTTRMVKQPLTQATTGLIEANEENGSSNIKMSLYNNGEEK